MQPIRLAGHPRSRGRIDAVHPHSQRAARILCFFTAAILILTLMPPAIANAAAATLKSGMSGADVKTLQTNLIQRGYLTDTADGKYGASTQTAVKLFQKQAGMTADGVAGAKTQALLFGLVGTGKTDITLKSGDNNAEVGILQKRLAKLGYMTSSQVDNDYGAASVAAVKAFQGRAKLKADGTAGPATLIKLYSPSAPKPAKGYSPPDPNALKLGMSGAAVKTLQNNLVKRGYIKKADGKYGSGTQKAVKLFQSQAGLKADGIAGTTTQNILYNLKGSGQTALTLKSGSTSSQVTILQTRLQELGYLRNTTISNNFNAATKDALKKFQTKVGFKADGVAGPKTLVKLYSPSAPLYRTKGEQVADYARGFLGIKYVYGKADPSVGFDCSGLVYYIYKHYFGITLPRSAHGLTVAGTEVALKDARPGDILCFGSSVAAVGHVGIYIGNNQFIEAPQTGENVKITTLKRAVATVRRIFTD